MSEGPIRRIVQQGLTCCPPSTEQEKRTNAQIGMYKGHAQSSFGRLIHGEDRQ